MSWYCIVEWDERYEVDDHNCSWTPGKPKRKGALLYIRLIVHGIDQGKGWRKLLKRAGRAKALMVFGAFTKLLEIAGKAQRGHRNQIHNGIGEDSLAYLLGVPAKQITFALAVLCDIKWIEVMRVDSGNSRDSPEIPASPPRPDQTRPEQNRSGSRARASGGGSVSEAVASPGEPGPSQWALARAEARTAFPGDSGIADALNAIGNSFVSDPAQADEVAGTIRGLIRQAKSKADKPTAYFMGALGKRYPCTRQKGKRPDAKTLQGISPPGGKKFEGKGELVKGM